MEHLKPSVEVGRQRVDLTRRHENTKQDNRLRVVLVSSHPLAAG